MLPARATLTQIVKRIYEMTRSTSVTIRVVTPDQRALSRFAAWPCERLSDGHRTIRIGANGSVNAWVARTGTPCYIPNMMDNPTRPFPGLGGVTHVEQRREIRSELCLPIKAHGRLVGTLNLESQHRSDYPDDVAAVVGALAQQAGLAISQARRNDERRLFSFQARQAGRAHRVLGDAERLDKLLKQHDEVRDSAFGIKLAQIAASIRDASDPEQSKPFDVEPVGDGVVSAKEVVGGVVSRSSYRGHLEVDDLPAEGVELLELVGQILTLALDELIRNALRVVSSNSALPFRTELRFSTIDCAGRPYLRIEVVNRIAAPLDVRLERDLYRQPIRTDRTHIGAFVIGSFVRSVGGEAYVNQNGRRFGARIELPIALAGVVPTEPVEVIP